MTEVSKKSRAILGDIDLDVYIGETDVFIRVVAPNEPGLSNWPNIQRFYRWAAANGMDENEIWKEKLSYAKIPLRWFKNLQEDFSIKMLSKRQFYAGE